MSDNFVEEWRRIPDFPEYEASNMGRIRSWRARWGKSAPRVSRCTATNRDGYLVVGLTDATGRNSPRMVHSLVAAAFYGPRPEGMVTRHLNGDKTDARLSNLTYGTPRENNLDTVAHGGNQFANRTHCKNGHAFTADNILSSWGPSIRRCRECVRQISERQNRKRTQKRAQEAKQVAA